MCLLKAKYLFLSLLRVDVVPPPNQNTLPYLGPKEISVIEWSSSMFEAFNQNAQHCKKELDKEREEKGSHNTNSLLTEYTTQIFSFPLL